MLYLKHRANPGGIVGLEIKVKVVPNCEKIEGFISFFLILFMRSAIVIYVVYILSK